jgi:hypothetical protein
MRRRCGCVLLRRRLAYLDVLAALRRARGALAMTTNNCRGTYGPSNHIRRRSCPCGRACGDCGIVAREPCAERLHVKLRRSLRGGGGGSTRHMGEGAEQLMCLVRCQLQAQVLWSSCRGQASRYEAYK